MVGGNRAITQTNFTNRKNQAKTTKSKNHDFSLNSKNKEARTSFVTPKARLTFTQLRQAFVEAPIFHHFDLKCLIQIQINASKYAIDGILNQLTLYD